MSYFSIKNFIEAGEKAIEDKNYWGALSIALALPSMCSRIEFDKPENLDTYFKIKNNGEKRWEDKKCYIDFCNQTMRTGKNKLGQEGKLDGYLVAILGVNFPEVLYQLRCGFVHEGDMEFCANGKKVYFSLGDLGTNTDFEDKITIKIKNLCEEVFHYIKNWCYEHSYTCFKYVYVLDLDNNESDRKKYKELCLKAQEENDK